MKTLKTFFTGLLCFFFTITWAQKQEQCTYCKMDINDELHQAIAKKGDNTLHFDAIECLINYLKQNDENSFSTLKVADYNSGKMVVAET